MGQGPSSSGRRGRRRWSAAATVLVVATGALAAPALTPAALAQGSVAGYQLKQPSSLLHALNNTSQYLPPTTRICGTRGAWYDAALRELDRQVNDPEVEGGKTYYGNYPNSMIWQFTPQHELRRGEFGTVTVSVPAPPQPYSPAGADLPPQQLDLDERSYATETSVFYYGTSSQQPNGTKIEVVVAVRDGKGQKPPEGTWVSLYPRDPADPGAVTADEVVTSDATALGRGNADVDDNGNATFWLSGSDIRRSLLAEVYLPDASQFRVVDAAYVEWGEPPVAAGPCADATSFPSEDGGSVAPWLLVYDTNTATGGSESFVGQAVEAVTVEEASGEVTARVSVPATLQAGKRAYLVAATALSPPRGDYAPEQFPIHTPYDSTPAYPDYSQDLGPVFDQSLVPDAGLSSMRSDELACGAATWCRTVSETEGIGVIATIRDALGNIVPEQPVGVEDLVSGGISHARVLVGADDGTHPRTAEDGTVTAQVSNTCAETVRLQAVVDPLQEVDDKVGPLTVREEAYVRFTSGAPVAPADPTRHSDCGRTPTDSEITVGSTVQTATAGAVRWPGDGLTPLPVKVRLADAFGNPATGESLVLLDPTGGGSGSPDPSGAACTPGAACTDATGTAGFDVVGDAVHAPSTSDFQVTTLSTGTTFSPADRRNVARVEFLPVDPDRSTVTASATTIAADGESNTLVTVALRTADGQAMRGRALSLASDSATFTAVCDSDPSRSVCRSDDRGDAKFLVANTVAETVTVTAQLRLEGVALPTPLVLTYKDGGASFAMSPSTGVADGASASEIRYALTDLGGGAVTGASVTITGSDGSSVTAKTDSNGNAARVGADGEAITGSRPTVTTKTPGEVTYTAVATYTPSAEGTCPGRTELGVCTVGTAPFVVTWLPAPHALTYSVEPEAVPADGRTSLSVVVTARDAGGAPIPRLTLQLVPDTATVGMTTPGPAPSPALVVTDDRGTAEFRLIGTEAGQYRYRAEYQSATWTPVGADTALVEFLSTQKSSSTITAPDGDSAPGDGSTPVRVEVLMQTNCGVAGGCEPLPGTPVALETGSATARVTSTDPDGVTDAFGMIRFDVTDTVAESLQVYARDLSRNVRIGPLLLHFLPGEADVSTVVANPAEVEAGGTGSSVTVTLLDHDRQPLPDRLVTLGTSSSAAQVTPVNAVTDDEGVARFTVKNSRIEDVVLRATDATSGVRLTQTATVRFVGSEANRSTVHAALREVPAGGPGTTLAVTLRDGSGVPLAGRPVEVLGASPATTVRPLLSGGVTDSNGVAEFEVASSAVETLTLAARDTSNGVVVHQTATVVFAAHESNQSIVLGPGALAAQGPSGVVKVTLRDAGGAALSGHTVSLLSSSSTAQSSPASATTDASGVALFAVSDPVVEVVEYTALDRSTGVRVLQTAVVDFFADEANQSTASASPVNQKIRKPITVTVTLRDASGAPLAGHGVALDTGSSTATVKPLSRSGVTDGEGVLQFEVTDKSEGRRDIRVTDTTTGVTLYRPVTVYFYRP